MENHVAIFLWGGLGMVLLLLLAPHTTIFKNKKGTNIRSVNKHFVTHFLCQIKKKKKKHHFMFANIICLIGH
jgi:hypothetical protein